MLTDMASVCAVSQPVVRCQRHLAGCCGCLATVLTATRMCSAPACWQRVFGMYSSLTTAVFMSSAAAAAGVHNASDKPRSVSTGVPPSSAKFLQVPASPANGSQPHSRQTLNPSMQQDEASAATWCVVLSRDQGAAAAWYCLAQEPAHVRCCTAACQCACW
jgi:hypothetical protein